MVRNQLLTGLGIAALLLPSAPTAAATSPELRAALAVGDCATAVALDPAPTGQAERLAIGRCQARLGQPEPALALLSQVSDPGLAAYAGLVQAEALVAARRWQDALEQLSGLSLRGEAADRVALLRGRCAVELGQWQQVRSALNPLLAGDAGAPGALGSPQGADPGEVRWWLAQGAIRRGEPDKAVPVLQNLWARNPSSAWAGPAQAWLTAQGHPLTAQASPAVLQERVQALDAQRRYAEGLELRDQLGQALSAGEEARLAFRAKDYPRAVAAYARLSSPTPSQRFDHALATSRTGDYAAAARLYRGLVDAAPSSRQADQASFKLGYLAYDDGDLDAALPLLRAHLRRYPSSRHADEARWFIGWSLVRLGRLDEAETAFAELLARHGSSSLAPQAAYWQARILDQRGQADAATDAYRAVLRRWPRSGSAWFASERLGDQPAGIPTTGPRPGPPAGLQGDAWQRGTALAEVGLLQWARSELRGLKGAAEAGGQQARIALALALVDAGDYVGAQALARPYCGTPWESPGDPWALRACYPRPHADLVASVAAESSLDPLLPYAIMNAESALKPWVTSIAGARGLMQLMPKLAAEHHERRFPSRGYDADDLYQPAYNATLGTTELGTLREHFADAGVQPELPLVIAGYNGGEEAVRRWLSAYDRPPDGDRFAEDVGYTETRRYVKRVLGYLQTYRYVYGSPAADAPAGDSP